MLRHVTQGGARQRRTDPDTTPDVSHRRAEQPGGARPIRRRRTPCRKEAKTRSQSWRKERHEGQEAQHGAASQEEETPKTLTVVKSGFSLETAKGKLSIVVTPSDFKRVDGSLLPHKVIQEVVGLQKIEIVTESTEHNAEIPPDRFKVPAGIQDILDID